MSEPDALSLTLRLTVAGQNLSECALCSAMVPESRMPRHVRLMHEGWDFQPPDSLIDARGLARLPETGRKG